MVWLSLVLVKGPSVRRKPWTRDAYLPAVLLSLLFGSSPSLAQTDAFEADFAFQETHPQGLEPVDAGGDFLSGLSINGYLKNETAFRFDEPRSITKIRNIFYLDSEYRISSRSNFVFSGWAYYDLAYDLFDYKTISGRAVRDEDQPLVFVDNLRQEKDSPVADIRELYLDFFTENMDIRIGKQFIVWGVLEGIRITDELNPLDFRELILPDLLDYRIPLWSLKMDYYFSTSSLELVWIPDIRFHKPAPQGSEWELLQRVPGTVEPDTYELENSELGFKFSSTLYDTEVSLSYFWTWDDFPVVFREIDLDSSQEPKFFPTYTRIQMFGATFVRQIGARILKGEIAYVPDKFFGLRNDVDRNNDRIVDSQGELRKKHIRWGLGLDFNAWGADWSPAISQWIILDYDNGLIQDEFDTSLTLFARKPLPRHSAIFELLAIALVNLEELYLNPELTFEVTDRFQIGTGLNLFFGNKSQFGVTPAGNVANLNTVEQRAQFFGNFNDNDRVYATFKYTF